jgi:deoxyadenosine/deoxycytidine kinase
MSKPYRIELAGSIAAGKTTLCNFLEQNGFRVVSEKISENPYLGKAFADPGRRGFYVQTGFLLSKCAALEEKTNDPRPVISDYALVVEYAYSKMHLEKADPAGRKLADECTDFMRKRLGAPDLLVYLKISPQAELDRIQERMKNNPERAFEKGLTLEYLTALGAEIDRQVQLYKQAGGKVLALDGDTLDLRDPAQARKVMDSIRPPGNPAAPRGPAF